MGFVLTDCVKAVFLFCALSWVAFLPSISSAADGPNKTMFSVSFLNVFSGQSYDAKFGSIVDSSGQYSELAAVPLLSTNSASGVSTSFGYFDGMGAAVGVYGVLGGVCIMGLDLSWLYRDDLISSSANKQNTFDKPYVRNDIAAVALDVGWYGGASSYFSWVVSLGFGAASDTMTGQYPVYLEKQYPNTATPPTAVGYTLGNGKSMLYYDDAQFTLLFLQAKINVGIKAGKTKSSPEIFLGYKGTYSQVVDIPNTDVTDFYLDLPSTPMTKCTPGASACPTPPYSSVSVADVNPPLSTRSRYYMQGFDYRTNFFEIGVRVPMGA